MKENKKGSLLEIKDGEKSQYFFFPSVHGLADFAYYLFENRANAAGEPIPLWKRIPNAEEITETAWSALVDDLETAEQYTCNMILEIPLDLLWVNEDIGEGGSYYAFSFSAVMEAAASGTHDLWKRLLAQYPNARKGF